MSTPRFVTGSLLRHITTMAGTGAIGLVAIFAVDLINLLYISRLGESAIAAAVGFSGVVGFFHLSLFIGMLIGIAAVVSRLIGARRIEEAHRIATSSLVITALIALLLSALTLVFLEPILRLLGAEGRVLELAAGFLRIHGGANPLDASAVHPESYGIVKAMAADLGCSVSDLLANAELRRRIRRPVG